MTSIIRAILVSALTVGMVSVCSAQDLLPRDDSYFEYHRAPRYRDTESHPLRTLAYILHPVGWALREGIYRPWSALAGSSNFTRSFLGFREPFDYRETECFDNSGAVPDCWSLPPLTQLIDATGGLRPGQGDGEAGMNMSERQVFFPDVAFDFDKNSLNDLGRGRVRQIAQLLASVPNLTVVVEGHTDYVGSDDYNQALGTRRAEAVINELGELGIDPARMSPVTYGESRPIFTEEEDWARAVNRRVQFSVQGS